MAIEYPRAWLMPMESEDEQIDIDSLVSIAAEGEIYTNGGKAVMLPRMHGSFAGRGVYLDPDFDYRIVRDEYDALVLLVMRK